MNIYPILNNSNVNTAVRILVIGVGGCGVNQVRDLIKRGIAGVDYVVANTDESSIASILNQIESDKNITSIILGKSMLGGKGTGANPEIGRKAAEESKDEILKAINGYDIVFVCAGMGKGTGTGAAPYIAQLAREQGSLTISVITMPKTNFGSKSLQKANDGLGKLLETSRVIAISNNKLRELYPDMNYMEADSNMNIPLVNAMIAIIKVIHNENSIVKADLNDLNSSIGGVGYLLCAIGVGLVENEAHLEALNNALNYPLTSNYKISADSTVILHKEYGENFTPKIDDDIDDKIQSEYNNSLEIIPAKTLVTEKEDITITIIAPAEISDNNVEQTKETEETATNSISLIEKNLIPKQMPINGKLIGSVVEKPISKYKNIPIKTNQNDLFDTNVNNKSISTEVYNDIEQPNNVFNDIVINEPSNVDTIPEAEVKFKIQNFLNYANQPNYSGFINEMNGRIGGIKL